MVFDIAKILQTNRDSSTFPAELLKFLEDTSIAFVGVGVKTDGNYLMQDYGVAVANKEDLRTIYKSLGFATDARKGRLSYFVCKLLGCSLPCKELRGVRASDCSSGLRTVEQQQYAALDAWATALVFESMLKSVGKANHTAVSSP